MSFQDNTRRCSNIPSRKSELLSKARTQTSPGSIKRKKRARVGVQQASVEVKEPTRSEKRGRDPAGELIFCERDNEQCFLLVLMLCS
jgi:hypothetical protein